MQRISCALFAFILTIFLFSKSAQAQCPNAGFNSTGAVCAGQAINLNNITTGATNYLWDFCGGDFSTLPVVTRDTASATAGPMAVSPVFDGTNWYAFMISDDASIVRLDYGPTLNSVPAFTNLGNVGGEIGGPHRSNMSVFQYAGNWYGMLANQATGKLIRYDFTSSLANVPTTSSVTYPAISGAWFQNLVVDNGHYYLFVATFSANISLFDFGLDPTSAPTVSTITASGIITDIKFEKICDSWYGFLGDFSGSVKRLDFGTSLTNASPALNVITDGLSSSVSLATAFDGKDWVIFAQSFGAALSELNFGNDLLSTTPVVSTVSLPGFTGSGINVSVAKEQSAFYLFTTSFANSAYGTIKYEAPCSASPSTSAQVTPAGVIYSSGGTYWVSISATDGSGNTDYFADSLNISYAPNTGFIATGFCLGDITQFTDTSTIQVGTITQWHWDFGDTDTSDQQNITHTYAISSTDTVTLTAYASSGCASTATLVVDITPRPAASFILPNGCSDVQLLFTDNSNISAGTISNWLWTFGNGDSSSLQSPYYGFPDGGNFNITLQATSAAGCSDDTTFSISISPSPDAAFIATNTCIGQTVSFTDQTTSQAAIAFYSWDFGDLSGTSAVASPTYTYATAVPATYNVTFIVQSVNSCSDTVMLPVHVSNPPSALFNYTPPNACQGNMVMFTDQSNGNGDTISGWQWNFDDGSIDSIMNPSHVFDSAGTFHVSLIAYSPSSCPSSPFIQDVVVIQSPIANIGYSEVCLGDAIPFTDLSTPPFGSTIVSRMWNFDDGDSTSVTDPFHTFAAAGVHQVILTVTTNYGCTNSDTIYVAVHAHPVAAYSYQNACTDYATLFTNNSTTSEGYISVFEWNFGDPGSASNTSGLENPTHTYDSASVGFHSVYLIVTNNFGCRDSVLQTIDVNFSVIPNFTYSPTCLGDIMSFSNFSQNSNLDSTWTWNFGDQQTISIQNPAHYYVYAGTYTVTLTALSVDGCLSSASKDVVVSDIPVADFSTLPACIHTPYQFTDNSSVSNGSITAWDWTLDTLATDTVQNPLYTFDATGTYSVNLVVYSDIGCVDSVRKNVTVHALPVPNFTYSPQYGNPPLVVNFTNLTDILGQCSYAWDFGDNTSGSSSIAPQHNYLDTGRFEIQLIATSNFGCVDSISKGIYVIKPVLDAAVTDVSASLVNNQLSIQANIANLGTVDIDSVIMQAQLQDGTVIEEVYHQLLPNGSNGIQSYDFVARFNIPPSSSVDFYCVSVIKPNGKDDDVQSNNEKCSSLTNEFSIMEPFPNPFTDQLQMNAVLPYEDYLTVELYNNLGQKLSTIFDGQGTTGLNLIHADFSSLADGVYTIRFSFREQDVVRQVIKSSNKKD